MAQTLTQYEYLNNDMLLKGVCEWIVNESPILKKLPQMTIGGKAYVYNVELTQPSTSWLTVGDTIVESTGTFEQRSTDLFTIIGDADTDKYAIATNKIQDPEQVDIEAKAKAMAYGWEKGFIQGRTSTLSTTKEPKGLMLMLAELEASTTTDLDGLNNTQVVLAASTSGAITMALMDKLLDQIKPGKPDLLLMSRLARQKLNALQRASGSGVQMIEMSEFGAHVPSYDTIPVLISDYVPNNLPDAASSVTTISTWNPATTRASTVDNTIIFAMKLGEKDITGLQAMPMTHERETFIEGKDVIRNRFKWYCGFATFKKYSLAALVNANPDS